MEAMGTTGPWYRRSAWMIVFGLAVLLVLFGAFVLATPVDAGDFETETGQVWSDFSAVEPDAAAYLEREARLLASITAGFGVLAAGMAYTLLRRGNKTAWALSWTIPGTFALAAVVFLAAGSSMLGSVYVVAALLAALAVALARPMSPAMPAMDREPPREM